MSLFDKLKQFGDDKLNKQKEEGKLFLEKNAKVPGVVSLPGDIQYQVIQPGTGRSPSVQSTIKAHYKGSLLSGKEFDNSFKRGQPFVAPISNLIQGWQQVLPLMQEGSTWKIWIPSDLAYGDRGAGGSIPGGATLVFEIELIEIVS
jgi:FKBP-type peptidyl-prolyl cis-trans isomerase FklB